MTEMNVEDVKVEVTLNDRLYLEAKIGGVSFEDSSASRLAEQIRLHIKKERAKIDIPVVVYDRTMSTFRAGRLRGINGKTQDFMITVDGEKRDTHAREDMLPSRAFAHLDELNALGQEIQMGRAATRSAERSLDDYLKLHHIEITSVHTWRHLIREEIDKVVSR